jgi:hypothetical protein
MPCATILARSTSAIRRHEWHMAISRSSTLSVVFGVGKPVKSDGDVLRGGGTRRRIKREHGGWQGSVRGGWRDGCCGIYAIGNRWLPERFQAAIAGEYGPI